MEIQNAVHPSACRRVRVFARRWMRPRSIASMAATNTLKRIQAVVSFTTQPQRLEELETKPRKRGSWHFPRAGFDPVGIAHVGSYGIRSDHTALAGGPKG